MADKNTYQFATTDMLLKSIPKTDKTRMTTLLESAGDDAIWNINKKDIKAGGLEWPKLKKVSKKGVAPQSSPIVILTDTVAFGKIKKGNFASADRVRASKKSEFKFLINDFQQLTFREDDFLIPDPRKPNMKRLSADKQTELQERGSAKIFELAINENMVFKNWKDIKSKYNGEAYDALKEIWSTYGIGDVEDEWIINFYKQHKALLPHVGDKKFSDFNRDGGFMDFITDLVKEEFGHIVGTGKGAKDNWNPADVWLVKNEAKNMKLIESQVKMTGKQSSLFAESQLKNLNNIMRSLYRNKEIMGISLKKVTSKKATYVVVNVGKKFLDKIDRISKVDPFTYERSVCDLTVQEKKPSDWRFGTEDTSIIVDAGGEEYKFQVKQNVTSSSSVKYDNLKFEPTAKGAAGARLGKAAVSLVLDILKGYNIRFYNENRLYPKTRNEFNDFKNDYLSMITRIRSQGVDIGGVTAQEAIDNIEFMFGQPEMRWPSANSKLMQITFLDLLLRKDDSTRNKIFTNILFGAMKFGKRFGPHGKIY